MNYFSMKELKPLTGMDDKNLHAYIGAGKLKPAQEAKGSGTAIRLSPTNLMQASIIHECIRFSLQRRTIFQLLDSLDSKSDVDKLNPYKIAEYKNEILLHFFSGLEGEVFHKFELGTTHPGDTYEAEQKRLVGGIDLTDFHKIPLSIRFNLSLLAGRLLKKIEA